MRRLLIAVLGAACLFPEVAPAQDAGGCAKFKWSVERERTAFAAADIGTYAQGQPSAAVARAVAVKLAPQSSVAFVKPPGKRPKAEPAFAAVIPVAPLTAAGTYQVTLSDEAWIDVIQNGGEVRSSNFSGQPNCPGVRKSVRFALEAGPATIQVSGSASDSVKLEIVPAN